MNRHILNYPNSLKKRHDFCFSQVVSRSHNNKDVKPNSKTGSPKINMFERAICELEHSINVINGCYKGHMKGTDIN